MAGAVLGGWIADPRALGLDFALTAMFIGLLVQSIASRKKVLLDLLVAGIAVLAVIGAGLLFSANASVILAVLAAATIGMVMEKWK